MFAVIRTGVLLFLSLTAVTGIVYPLVVTGVARLFFSQRANGSLLDDGGRIIGSALVGQEFDEPRYFWGRPSATAPLPYNALAGSGSNLAPSNPALVDAVKARSERLRREHPDQTGRVPVDLVTTSASGLDPHITPAAAEYQVARVARLRGLSESRVRELIAELTEGPSWGLFGGLRVNVLRLNVALDKLATQASH